MRALEVGIRAMCRSVLDHKRQFVFESPHVRALNLATCRFMNNYFFIFKLPTFSSILSCLLDVVLS